MSVHLCNATKYGKKIAARVCQIWYIGLFVRSFVHLPGVRKTQLTKTSVDGKYIEIPSAYQNGRLLKKKIQIISNHPCSSD